MSWDIRVSHESIEDRVRMTIEVTGDVDEEVIGTIAASYWEEEIRYAEEWEEVDELDDGLPGPGGGLHG